jgi:hypothetical protein
MPAQFTTVRSGASRPAAAATAAATDASSDTSVLTNSPPISSATFLPLSSFRSAMTTVLPAAASSRAAASPRPLAPPEMIAAVPLSSMAGSITGPAAARGGRLGAGTAAAVVGTAIYDQNRTAAHHGPSPRGGAIKIYLE